MVVGNSDNLKLFPVKGIRASACSAGLYKNERLDLAVIEINENAICSAVFTRNKFCAAPVMIAKQHLKKCNPRYLVINAGNANAGLGKKGYEDALSVCKALSNLTGCSPKTILPFSTGVIGEPLPVSKITSVLAELVNNLSDDSWDVVARAIMTTDTRSKGITKSFDIDGLDVTITAIAKGSGMIMPNMATMLAYIATDAKIENKLLDEMLQYAVERSFNRISVDGDTSTNDACVLIATGETHLPILKRGNYQSVDKFREALTEVCIYLAKSIVRDGEGSSKFVTVNVQGGKNHDECLIVAWSIANSPLVKTALFASDPNWGRILAAVGNSDINDLDINRISIFLDDMCIVENGERANDYLEEKGQAVMNQEDITIRVILNRGEEKTKIWTCDLSHEYVRINTEYRT